MKAVLAKLVSVLPVAVVVLFARPVLAQCVDPPGPGQITVWQDHFAGQCKTFAAGSYLTASALLPMPNNAISSIKVGSGVRAFLFRNEASVDLGGSAALYEAGSIHSVSFSGTFALGPNVNDQTSSIIVQPTGGVRIPYIFGGNYPSNRVNFASSETQGICHSSTHWFITKNSPPTLYKIPLGSDLNQANPAVLTAGVPPVLASMGHNHMGDPDCSNGFVFVPFEKAGLEAAVAIYDGSSAASLSFVNWDTFYVNDDNMAGWVAIDPSNGVEAWTSRSHIIGGPGAQGVFKYTIDWSQVVPGGGFVFFAGAGPAVTLNNWQGSPLELKAMQGGVFDTTGDVLYLTNSDSGTQSDGRGILSFLKSSGQSVGHTGGSYGPFNYEVSGFGMEEEGIDYFPTNTSMTPGISGDLHAVLLNNNLFSSDSWYFKHFRKFQ